MRSIALICLLQPSVERPVCASPDPLPSGDLWGHARCGHEDIAVVLRIELAGAGVRRAAAFVRSTPAIEVDLSVRDEGGPASGAVVLEPVACTVGAAAAPCPSFDDIDWSPAAGALRGALHLPDSPAPCALELHRLG